MAKSKKKKEFSGNITLTRAVKIFEALGFKTAGKWDAKRLEQKIKNLPTLVEGAELTPKIQKRVNTVLRALKRGQKITVIDVEDIEPGKKRDKAVKDAEKRASAKKNEKLDKKERKTTRVAKKAAKEAKKKEPKKPGVIASILEFIQNNGPISRKQILSKLKNRFPDREAEGMEKTIQAQLPNRMSNEKKVKIKTDDKGCFSIKK